jgi:glycosyltransferase involved in cell wall biosynthesis
MISICIPVYNFNVVDLVTKLSNQAGLLNVPSEIILIDDCSDSPFQKQNESICKKEIYIRLEKNIGRAAIRNRFLNYSKFDNLLFLDCDSVVISDNFLSDYVQAIKEHPNCVICGGREYQKSSPERNKMLRWKYGLKRESKSCMVRNQDPCRSFMTNNFGISRKIFELIRFDERLIDYGHEDTLFGFELKKRNINIIHINNPVLNGYLEKNEEYIKKTELAISNLRSILQFTNYDKDLIESIALLHIYYNVYKARRIIQIIFIILKPLIKYLLSKGFINLELFDFYKLGTFIHDPFPEHGKGLLLNDRRQN